MALDTYDSLQGAILDWLGRPGDPLVLPAVPDWIRLFEIEANRRLRTRWQELTVVLTPEAGDVYVDLPLDFAELRSIRLSDTEPTINLRYLTPEQITRVTGPYFTIEGLLLRLAAPADPGQEITIGYMQGLPPLSDTVTTNWLLENHPDTYLFGSLVEAEAYIMNDERAALCLQRRDAGFASIIQADRHARLGGGPLQVRPDIVFPFRGDGRNSLPPEDILAGYAKVTIDELPPPNPEVGDLWWCSASQERGGGRLYIFYFDPSGNPGQWVLASNLPGALQGPMGPAGPAGPVGPVGPEGQPAPAKVFISDIPPPHKVPGQMWWESDSGQLFLWYDDGTSAQWVPATNNSVGPVGGGGNPLLRYIPVLADNPVSGPGAGRVALFGILNGDGSATLRVQAGTSATATDLIVNFGEPMTTTDTLPIYLPALLGEPVEGPGVGWVSIYALRAEDGSASLFVQSGEDGSSWPIIVGVGAGV